MKSDVLRDPEKRKRCSSKNTETSFLMSILLSRIPDNGIQLISSYHSLKSFLTYRAGHTEQCQPDATSKNFISNPALGLNRIPGSYDHHWPEVSLKEIWPRYILRPLVNFTMATTRSSPASFHCTMSFSMMKA